MSEKKQQPSPVETNLPADDLQKKKNPPLKSWQKVRLWVAIFSLVVIGFGYIAIACVDMLHDRKSTANEWKSQTNHPIDIKQELEDRSQGATDVLCGTYIENLKNIDLKGSSFRAVMLLWFRWEGDEALDLKNHYRFYKGYVNTSHLVEEYHEGNMHYQQLRVDVTITKIFDTNRFPLDSQQLHLYLECDHPVEKVRLRMDPECGTNESLEVAGYRITNAYMQETHHRYASTHANPLLTQPEMTSEILTTIELSRDSFGLYLKCFIALFGTTVWVFVAMFICTYHRVDPLGMIPGALFGTVSNIMVGASIVPDTLSLGLLEYINLWGVMTVLAAAICIINMNRIRSKYSDHAFAKRFGRIMFALMLVIVLTGHILMPLCAYAL